MAQTMQGLGPILYDAWIDDYASEYADMVAGSKGAKLLFGRPYDEAKWQEAFGHFKAKCDTPEKLMDFAAALHEAQYGDAA